MKKIFSCTLIIFTAFLCAFGPAAAAQAGPQVSARSAVLLDADTGEILCEKDAGERLAMASTTKIMTALLALEAAAVDDRVVTVTDEMVRVEGSSMGLRAGDRLSLRNIAAGMLAVSGNDAANTVAIAVGGSAMGFATLMNARAAELGMENTHFVTPSGLDDEAHYSTAKDMAVLTVTALKNESFAKLVRQSSVKVDYAFPVKQVSFTNHNKLLRQYEGCVGVKTGFTKKAGRCLVSAAERDGARLIAVTLNAPNDWDDHKRLLDYGFSLMERMSADDSAYTVRLPVAGGGSVTVRGTASGGFTVQKASLARVQRRVELPRFVYAPVPPGQVLGRVLYLLDGRLLACTELTAAGAE